MTRLVFASLVLATWASASDIEDNQALIQQKVDSLDYKRGLEVGGTIRSIFFHSLFTSPQDVNAYNITPDQERDEITQFDLKLGFRPFEDTRANLVIRMGADMQDYFENASKSISVPWINVEGKKGQTFHWVAGNFREQYTPLTLWSPNIDIMEEPLVYKRNRDMARDQVFLQGNERNLEGINLQYRDGFGTVLDEVRAEGIFSRLNRIGYLDTSGVVGNILPGNTIQGASEASSMDKYLASANEEVFALKSNVMLGATQMLVWDDASSLTRSLELNQTYYNNGGTNSAYMFQYAPVANDTLPQHTAVFSFRAGADFAGLAGLKNWTLSATLEYAMDKDRVYNTIDTIRKAADGTDSVLTDLDLYVPTVRDTVRYISSTSSTLGGSAILAQFDVGYHQDDSWKALISAKYIMNDSAWFNSLAQSPSFFPRRIMNSDKDGNTIKFGVNSPLYSTFDALYHFDPKFSPIATSLGNDDNSMKAGQTASYNIAPFAKNSWTTAVLSRTELNLVNSLLDPNLQLCLPNGLASANRAGLQANVSASFLKDGPIEVQGLVSSFTQVKAQGSTTGDKAQYSEMGAGGKVDVFKLLGFKLPLEFSGSYKTAQRTQDAGKLTTDFINASVYTQFYKRFGITAGYQNIAMNLNTAAAAVASGLGVGIPLVDGKQWQWMVGLDYTINANAWFSLNYGNTNVKNQYTTSTGLVDTTGAVITVITTTAENLPNYIIANTSYVKANSNTIVSQFTLHQIEATVNVAF